MKFDKPLFQFLTSVVAMICLVVLVVMDKADASIISLFSAIMGAGAWGGAQRLIFNAIGHHKESKHE